MTDAPTALRVVTWNIRAAIGPEKPFPDRWWRLIDAERLRAIGDVLAGIDADVIALQEVALASRDGELLDNAGDLARQLGMNVRYGATRTFGITDGRGTVTGAGCFGNCGPLTPSDQGFARGDVADGAARRLRRASRVAQCRGRLALR